MSLLALQRDFRDWLQTADQGAADRIAPGREGGFGIYQNNYRAQLAECLEGSFPVTRQWIGEAAFHGAVVEHVDTVPPSSWTLDHYPLEFPQTLRRRFADHPEVCELATLELSLEQAFVAPDEEPISAERLAGVDWDTAVLCFTASLQVHEIRTNAVAIWSALTDEEAPPAVEVGVPGSNVLLIWRSGLQSKFRTSDPLEGRLLTSARGGCQFGDLCEEIEGSDEDRVRHVGQCLANWLATGLVVSIEAD